MSALEKQLEQVTELISLPEVYLKIHRLMDDGTSDIDDFAEVIRLDPNLSARLLKVVNTAYFGFSGEINSISRAVNMLGIQQLHIMVLSISAVTAVSSLEFPEDIVDLKAFWRSSLLCGTLSRLLAKHLKAPSSENFFILGLLHEIGHLLLYANFADLARQSIHLSSEKTIPIEQAEKQLLGCHYGEIGAKLMKHWQLPVDFQDLTRFQPVPQEASDNKLGASILHIAHAYAYRQFFGGKQELADAINPVAWQATQLTTDVVDQILETALVTSAEMEKIILR